MNTSAVHGHANCSNSVGKSGLGESCEASSGDGEIDRSTALCGRSGRSSSWVWTIVVNVDYATCLG